MAFSDRPKFERNTAHVSGPVEADLIEAIAHWCECVQGRLPLMTALKKLADGLEAKAVCLSRHSRKPGGSVRAIAYNAPSSLRAGTEVARSYAQCVLGRYITRPRTASVWLSSLAEDSNDPSLEVLQKRARIAETIIVALALEEKWVDYIEIHLPTAASQGTQRLFNSLADTLSRTWTHRSPGLFSDAILTHQAQPRIGHQEALLSTANPAKLSRAEFRVCVLLSRGLNTTAVCSELAISPATLRAHLRSIFAKTETASLVELLYLLLAPWTGEPGSPRQAITQRA